MLLPIVIAPTVVAADRPAASSEIVFEYNVEMKTRDGVTLRADIYRPKADGKFPVLLNRNPYDKYIYIGDAMASAARGYVFIVQDARGRFASDGEWYPFKDEAQDTYDTVEWAAGLPYSNGKVGMVGISYVGVPELLGATAAPPHLVFVRCTGLLQKPRGLLQLSVHPWSESRSAQPMSSVRQSWG